MLDRRHRLTSSAEFSSTTRRGRRAGSATLVVHLAAASACSAASSRTPDRPGSDSDDPTAGQPPRVGLVVAGSVGAAVTRNRVRRRLRHLVRERLDRLPVGSAVVVRALPAAAAASYATLGRDLDSALRRVGAEATPVSDDPAGRGAGRRP